MTMAASTKGQFTGRKVTAIFVVFFGVIMAVNFTMASFASSTFGGREPLVVMLAGDIGVADHHPAEAQKKLGWSATLSRLPDDRVAVRFTGAPAGLTVNAVARHPLGRAPDQALAFVRAADGAFISTKAIAPGRWMVRIAAEAGDARWREEQELR
ncbi:MAG: FixH family protein [Novosphingobium sp.]